MPEGSFVGDLVGSIFGGGAQVASAEAAADASRYGADQAAAASRYGADQASRSVDLTNMSNAQIMSDNRNFQLDMSNSAYTRSVADMRNAGLNPAVMLQGAGGAASTTSGSTIPSQSNAAAESAAGGQEAAAKMSSALAISGVRKEIAEIASRTGVNIAQSALLRKKGREADQNIATSKELANKYVQESALFNDRGWNTQLNSMMVKAGLPAFKAKQRLKSRHHLSKIDAYIDTFRPLIPFTSGRSGSGRSWSSSFTSH